MTFGRFREMVQKRYESKKLPVPTEKNIVGSYRLYKLFHEATFQAAKLEIEQAQQLSH
jgi:hypothetical protein